jgi:hypothetical protein
MTVPCPRCQTLMPVEATFCPRCGLPRAQFSPGMPGVMGGAMVGAPASPASPAAPINPAMPFSPQQAPPSVPPAPAAPLASGMPPGAQGWPSASGPPQQVSWPGAQYPTQGVGQPVQPFVPGAGQGASSGKKSRSKRKRAVMIISVIVVLLVLVAVGLGYFLYRASAPTSFVIATDRGNTAIDRIDLATRSRTVLISNKALPTAPDSVVFISATQVLLDFAGNSGDIGLGDIQSGTYTRVFQGQDDLRDMAVRPDGNSVLIADTGAGKILEYHVADRSISTLIQDQNLSGVQGLAFDNNGNLYAAVGSSVYQLDPTSGRQLKSFALQAGSDGLAYDNHRNTLDVASGDRILALDPKTGKVTTLLDGLSGADGVAIDRHGNLFIASSFGVLELNTDNQLLIVGTNSNGVTWDDVAPLSGSGAVNY